MGNVLQPVFKQPYFRGYPAGKNRTIIEALIKRELLINEWAIVVDGQIITKTIRRPSLNDIQRDPEAILYTRIPTIEMWAKALQGNPSLIRYSPLTNNYIKFVTELQEHMTVDEKVLTHVHPETSGTTLQYVTEIAPVNLETLENLMNTIDFVPLVKSFTMSIVKSVKNISIDDYGRIFRISRKFLDSPDDKSFIIKTCFKELGEDGSFRSHLLLNALLEESKEILNNDTEIVDQACKYYEKHRTDQWLKNIVALLNEEMEYRVSNYMAIHKVEGCPLQ